MYSVRIRWAKRGGHVHARVFTSERGPDYTHSGAGTLIFREGFDWDQFCIIMGSARAPDQVIEFLKEEDET